MPVHLTLTLVTEDEPEPLMRQLRQEILELPVEDVDFGQREQPPGAKGTAIDWNMLLVTLVASGGVVTTLITVIQTWLTRHERSRIVVEIDGDRLELTSVTDKQRQEIIDQWLAQHSVHSRSRKRRKE